MKGKIEIVYTILVINSQVDVSCYRPDFIPKIYEFLGLCNFFTNNIFYSVDNLTHFSCNEIKGVYNNYYLTNIME